MFVMSSVCRVKGLPVLGLSCLGSFIVPSDNISITTMKSERDRNFEHKAQGRILEGGGG